MSLARALRKVARDAAVEMATPVQSYIMIPRPLPPEPPADPIPPPPPMMPSKNSILLARGRFTQIRCLSTTSTKSASGAASSSPTVNDININTVDPPRSPLRKKSFFKRFVAYIRGPDPYLHFPAHLNPKFASPTLALLKFQKLMDHHEPNHPKPKWDDLIKFQQWKESKIMGMLREKQKKVEMLDEEMDALKIKWKKDGEELLKLREEEEFRRDHRGHLAGYNMMVYR